MFSSGNIECEMNNECNETVFGVNNMNVILGNRFHGILFSKFSVPNLLAHLA